MRPKVLVIAGATAVGKTAVALDLAEAFNGEIINADSRQIYRYMDIGTAKPSPADQARVPHHLLDLATPDETLTLAQYQAAAYASIADITQRAKLPILCGGTGLYITATLEGWQMPDVPPNPELRAELEAQTTPELFARLSALDPATAATIDRHNPRRLVRALEVCIMTGQLFSDLRRKNPPNYDVLALALTLEPRERLYERADQRLEQMLAAGWPDEVENLLMRGYDPKSPSMTALGYPQMLAYLRGELSLEAAQTEIKRLTRDYIRRQYTWLRGHDAPWLWHEPDTDLAPLVAAWLTQ